MFTPSSVRSPRDITVAGTVIGGPLNSTYSKQYSRDLKTSFSFSLASAHSATVHSARDLGDVTAASDPADIEGFVRALRDFAMGGLYIHHRDIWEDVHNSTGVVTAFRVTSEPASRRFTMSYRRDAPAAEVQIIDDDKLPDGSDGNGDSFKKYQDALTRIFEKRGRSTDQGNCYVKLGDLRPTHSGKLEQTVENFCAIWRSLIISRFPEGWIFELIRT